jgi:hypothetical protein
MDQAQLLAAVKIADEELLASGFAENPLRDQAALEGVFKLVIEGLKLEIAPERPVRTSVVPDNVMELIVLRTGRTGPPKSIKPSNIAREISRTVYVSLLVGAASFTVSGPAGAVAALIGITYAAFNAASATVGYSDACVLHKAWKLAKSGDRDFVTKDELLAIKSEIAEEYSAPKCNSDVEILDAIENLKGLKAMVEHEGQLILKEKIVCFENGEIKN